MLKKRYNAAQVPFSETRQTHPQEGDHRARARHASRGEQVKVSFESPATPATVCDWFAGKLGSTGFKVAPSGSGLSGTTAEGKPFRLDLATEGGDKARGTILIG